jgi:hypothetical protein
LRRPRSGNPFFRRSSKDFNLNRPRRRTPHSRSPTDRLTSRNARETIGEALRPGRIVRATDFRTEARDPIALIKTATRAIATIEMDAMVARGIFGPIAIPSRRVNPSRTLRRRSFPPS